MNPRFQGLANRQSNFKRKRKHSCFLRAVGSEQLTDLHSPGDVKQGSSVGAVRALAFHRIGRHMCVEFVSSLLCSERLFPGYSGFPLWPKNQHLIWFDSYWFDFLSPQLVEPLSSAKYSWDINKVIIIIIKVMIMNQNVYLGSFRDEQQTEVKW